MPGGDVTGPLIQTGGAVGVSLIGSGAAAGAAAYGSAGYLAMLPGAAAPSAAVPVAGIILVGAALIYSIASRPTGRDRRKPGAGFLLTENPTDPNDPIGLGYGMQTFVPSILCRYRKRGGLNRLDYDDKAEDFFVVVLSIGGGPIDGRDLRVWANDEPLYEVIEADAEEDETNLVPDAARERFRVPKKDVVPDSVVLYRDGVLIGANASGGGVTDTVERTVSGAKVEPRVFYGDILYPPPTLFPALTGDKRYGGFLPLDARQETVRDLSVDLIPKQGATVRLSPTLKDSGGSGFNGTFFGISTGGGLSGLSASLISQKRTLPSSHVHLSTTTDGKTFFWVGVDTTGQYSGDNISGFVVSLRAKPTIEIVVDPDGWAFAVFEEAQPAGIVSATYRTSRYKDGAGAQLVETILRTGESDQDALPTDDGIRNTVHVGAELEPAQPGTFETANEVHDIEVLVASGPEGFADVAQSGTNAGDTRKATRRLQMRLRLVGAPDTEPGGTDLAAGWVTLVHPVAGKTMPVTGIASGQALWSFSVAELYFFARDGKETPGASLPLAKYEVEVRAIDVPGNRGNDGRTHASIQSRVFFEDATEVVRIRLALPYHATLTIRVKDPKILGSEPVFSVRLGMRRVVVPGADAEIMDLGDGPRPWERVGGVLVPSPRRWTRNPAWCAVDLITDPFFGAGQWYDWNAVRLDDEAGAKEAAEWCDSTEPGETMAELDLWIQRRSAVLDHVAQCFAGARVLPALTGGTWEFPIDRDGDPVLTFTDDDFERGSSLSHASAEEIPTEIEAGFLDEALGGELAPHSVSLPTGDPRRRNLRRVDMTGVRRRSQLDRVLKVHLAQFQLQKDSLSEVGANWRMLRLKAGRIVRVTDSEAGWDGQRARAMLVTWGSNLKVGVRFVVHDPDAYHWERFTGPNGGVVPASRPPSDAKSVPDAKGSELQAAATSSGISFEVTTYKALTKFSAAKVSTP